MLVIKLFFNLPLLLILLNLAISFNSSIDFFFLAFLHYILHYQFFMVPFLLLFYKYSLRLIYLAGALNSLKMPLFFALVQFSHYFWWASPFYTIPKKESEKVFYNWENIFFFLVAKKIFVILVKKFFIFAMKFFL